jgi:hypothetical protein
LNEVGFMRVTVEEPGYRPGQQDYEQRPEGGQEERGQGDGSEYAFFPIRVSGFSLEFYQGLDQAAVQYQAEESEQDDREGEYPVGTGGQVTGYDRQEQQVGRVPDNAAQGIQGELPG